MSQPLNLIWLLGSAPGADAPESAKLIDGAVLMLVGMSVVFMALVSIWVLMAILKVSLKRTMPPPKKPVARPASTPVPAPVTPAASAATDGIPVEIAAVLTAAVAAVVRRPFRIHRVKFVTTAASQSWAEHGRATIHRSHRLRKGPQ